MASYIERYERVEEVGELWVKGYKFTQIGRELNITSAAAAAMVAEYKELLKARADGDPDFLERITQNTLEMLDGVDLIIKEIWEAHQKAKDLDMLQMQSAFLKLAMESAEKKAKLLQLMGGNTDGGSQARINRAEKVNELITDVIKDIVAECPRCSQMAQIKIAEAFAIMGRAEAGSTMQSYEPDIVDAEIIELPEHSHEDVLKDILSEE